MIPLTRAIPERIRGGLRLCAIQIDVYFTYCPSKARIVPKSLNMGSCKQRQGLYRFWRRRSGQNSDRQTPDRYIMFSARRGRGNKPKC